MEKKARIKRLNHQDDVKRSWSATYQLEEEFEVVLPSEEAGLEADETPRIQAEAPENNEPSRASP
jgi:hypothetical protein